MWAIEQDEFSKRVIPGQDSSQEGNGQDVFVPWVLGTQNTKQNRIIMAQKDRSPAKTTRDERIQEPNKVFNRYYHMFSRNELHELTVAAAQELGLGIGKESESSADRGVDIVQYGWERSNYYIEIRRWRR